VCPHVAADGVARRLEALLRFEAAVLAGRAAAAFAGGQASTLNASLVLAAFDASTGIDAASCPTLLGVRTHDLTAGIDADAAQTNLAFRAFHGLASRVDAVAVGAADELAETTKLSAATRGDTHPAIADLVFVAKIAVVKRAVAVVVQAVTRFVAG
jgi:hypothetical protein